MAVFNMQELLQAAVKQGEGLGTAYEYYVKLRLLSAFFHREGIRPHSMLIAGLPEKYGYSMDFVLLADKLNSVVCVRDEREHKLTNFTKIFGELTSQKVLSQNIDLRTNSPGEVDVPPREGVRLAVSCEVLQRFTLDERHNYMNHLSQAADYIALFVPNAKNTAHARISGLRTMGLNELVQLVKQSDFEPVRHGYVDMPPFPPGLKRKRQEGVGAFYRFMHLGVMEGLRLWAHCEGLFGLFKSKNAHIVYVIALNKRSDFPPQLPLVK